jgi:hypothetical protein
MLATTQFKICVLPSSVRKHKIKTYKSKTHPVILYSCETWSLIVSEEHRLKVSENRALQKMFVPKGEDVKRNWRKFHMRNS